MELILLKIVDILYCINDKCEEKIIKEKIQNLANLIDNNFLEKVKRDIQKSENEKEFSKILNRLRG